MPMTRFHVFTLAAILGCLQGCAGALVAGGAGGAAIATDRRTAGTVVEDQSIEIKVNNKISSDKELAEQTHIEVTSYNNVILLTGEAPAADLRGRALGFAQQVEKARRVHNEIEIAPPAPTQARTTDGWITAKVKTRLLGNEDGGGFFVKVVTSNRVVYLMGLVTRGEGKRAATLASEVDGVTKVVKVFEYTD